jgi:hypothetical protein
LTSAQPRRVVRQPSSWTFIAALGYSFFVSVSLVVALVVVTLFYSGLNSLAPNIVLCPFYALAKGRFVSLITEVVVYSFFVYYNTRSTSRIKEEIETNEVARYTILALIFTSAIFDLTTGHPLNMRIGGFILANLLSSAAGAFIARNPRVVGQPSSQMPLANKTSVQLLLKKMPDSALL